MIDVYYASQSSQVEKGPWERGCLYSNILHYVIGNIWSCVSQILASFRFEDDDENEDKVQLLLIVRMLKSVAMMA